MADDLYYKSTSYKMWFKKFPFYWVKETIILKFMSTFELLLLCVIVSALYICKYLMWPSFHILTYVIIVANSVGVFVLFFCQSGIVVIAFGIFSIISAGSSTALSKILSYFTKAGGLWVLKIAEILTLKIAHKNVYLLESSQTGEVSIRLK